jgi:hypothetical protein
MTEQRHPNCEDPYCKICLQDASSLEEELLKRTGNKKEWLDILGAYRTWLDSEGIPAETAHGWPTAAFYDETNVASYITHRQGNGECPGIEIEPGIWSGCDQSGGDCPTCGY